MGSCLKSVALARCMDGFQDCHGKGGRFFDASMRAPVNVEMEGVRQGEVSQLVSW